ncbi:MAG: hypothetical protein WAU86_02575 [Oricola sp.]
MNRKIGAIMPNSSAVAADVPRRNLPIARQIRWTVIAPPLWRVGCMHSIGHGIHLNECFYQPLLFAPFIRRRSFSVSRTRFINDALARIATRRLPIAEERL